MKNIAFLLLMLIFSSAAVFAQTDPVDFNNTIIAQQAMVSAKNLEYISYSVHSKDFNEIELKRKGVVQQIESAIKVVNALEPAEHGDNLKEEALAVLGMYEKLFNMDFVEVNELKKDSESSFIAMEKYFKAQDKAEKQLSKAAKRLNQAQERFAKKSGFEIQESDENDAASLQIQKMNQVNEYTRNIYLIYFKAEKAHAIFMEAVSSEDRSMGGKLKRLESAADEALEKLKDLDGFDGDTGYKDSAIKLMKFFKEMSEGGFADIVRVSKMQQEKLTQKDVDDYNNAIQKYNENINPLLMQFNEASNALLKKHVPNLGVPKNKVSRT